MLTPEERGITKPGGRVLEQRQCAALNCRQRATLIRVKSFIPGVLVALWLCPDHEAQTTAAVHAKFRDEFGLDFVDQERQ